MSTILHKLYDEAAFAAQKYSFEPAEEAQYKNYARYCKIIKAITVIAAIILTTLNFYFLNAGFFFTASILGLFLYDANQMASNFQYIFENSLIFNLRNIFTSNFNQQIRNKLIENTVIFGSF